MPTNFDLIRKKNNIPVKAWKETDALEETDASQETNGSAGQKQHSGLPKTSGGKIDWDLLRKKNGVRVKDETPSLLERSSAAGVLPDFTQMRADTGNGAQASGAVSGTMDKTPLERFREEIGQNSSLNAFSFTKPAASFQSVYTPEEAGKALDSLAEADKLYNSLRRDTTEGGAYVRSSEKYQPTDEQRSQIEEAVAGLQARILDSDTASAIERELAGQYIGLFQKITEKGNYAKLALSQFAQGMLSPVQNTATGISNMIGDIASGGRLSEATKVLDAYFAEHPKTLQEIAQGKPVYTPAIAEETGVRQGDLEQYLKSAKDRAMQAYNYETYAQNLNQGRAEFIGSNAYSLGAQIPGLLLTSGANSVSPMWKKTAEEAKKLGYLTDPKTGNVIKNVKDVTGGLLGNLADGKSLKTALKSAFQGNFATYLIGVSAAGGQYNELMRTEDYDVRNFLNAFGQGFAEYFTEGLFGFSDMASFERFFDSSIGSGTTRFWKGLLNWLSGGGEEALEEVVNAPLGELVNLATGKKSDMVQELTSWNPAFQTGGFRGAKAILGEDGIFNLSDMVRGGLSGFVTGAVLGMAGSVASTYDAMREGADISKTVKTLNRFVKEELPDVFRPQMLDPNTASRKDVAAYTVQIQNAIADYAGELKSQMEAAGTEEGVLLPTAAQGENTLPAAGDAVQQGENAQAAGTTTAIDADPATHTPEQMKTIRAYINGADGKLRGFFERYIKNPAERFARYTISRVSARQADDVSRLLGGDYSGYQNAIDRNGVLHILKRHGENGTADHSMANLDDASRIGYILDNYDTVERTLTQNGEPDFTSGYRARDNTYAPLLTFSKKINGSYYVIEAVPDSSYQKMWVISAYIGNKNGGGYASATDAEAPSRTSETSLPSPASIGGGGYASAIDAAAATPSLTPEAPLPSPASIGGDGYASADAETPSRTSETSLPSPVSNTTISQPDTGVNSSIRESGEPDTSGGIMLPTASEPDAQFSIETIDGRMMPVIDTKNDTRNFDAAESYLKALVNTERPFATILRDAQPVYIGRDLPGEYRSSEYTKGMNKALRTAKMQAVTNLDEMLLLAENGEWRGNVKTKHRRDAANGWYRYNTEFAIPSHDRSGNITGYKVYGGTLLIRNDADGKSYLYDLIDIKEKKKASSSAASAGQIRTAVFEPGPSSNTTISQPDTGVNSSIRESGEPDTSGGIMLPTAEQAEETERLRRAATELERSGIEAGASDEDIQIARRLSNVFGREIRFYDGNTREGTEAIANGYYEENIIYVNSRSRNPVEQIISHELTHSLESAKVYGKLSKLILGELERTGEDLSLMRAEKKNLYARNGVMLSNRKANREIVAEYVGKNLLSNETKILEFTRKDWTLAQRISEWIQSTLAMLGNKRSQERVFLERAYRLYARALRQTQNETGRRIPQEAQSAMQNPTQASTAAQPTGVRKYRELPRDAEPPVRRTEEPERYETRNVEPAQSVNPEGMRELQEAYAAGQITDEEFDEAIDALMEEEGLLDRDMLEAQYSIEETKDGKRYVKADRQVIYGNDPEAWGDQVEGYINRKIRKGEDVALATDDGDILLLTSATEGKASFRNYVRDKNGRLRPMSDAEYETKLNAETHIDELAQISTRGNKTVPDEGGVHGTFAENGWNYRTAYFQDFDNKYYRVRLSVAQNSRGQVVYNVGDIQERTPPSFNGSSADNSGAQWGEALSNTTIPQQGRGVNRSIRESGEPDTSGGIMLPAANESDAQYSISENYAYEIDAWDSEGRLDGEVFILGTTGDVLQGLGAIEQDIYLRSEKINNILEKHPEMTLTEIKRIPEILDDPILVLKSRNAGRGRRQNTRLVLFGTVRAENGLPVLTVMDLRPVENGLAINDMQKITSSYVKDHDPVWYVQNSDILHADKKRTIPLLRTIGFQMPIELQQSGSMGSISYQQQNVNLQGVPFHEVVMQHEDIPGRHEPDTSGGIMLPTAEDRQYSISESGTDDTYIDDSTYRNAVRTNDTALQQRLVQAAAEYAMPGSRVRDKNGNLMPVYHGTKSFGFTVFDRSKTDYEGPFYFTSDTDAAASYSGVSGIRQTGYPGNTKGGEEAGNYAVYLNLKNPLIVDCRGSDWDAIPVPRHLMQEYLRTFPARHRVRTLDSPDLAEYAEQAGYDGVILRNIVDSGGELGYNEISDVYVAFSPEQIKSADAVTYDDNGQPIPLAERFRMDDDDIRYSISEDFAETCEKIEQGTLNRAENPFIYISRRTPQILIDYAGAEDLPVIISYESLYLAVREEGELRGHYHDLGADGVSKVVSALNNPEEMIRLENGRVNEILTVTDKEGKPVLASVEFHAVKDFDGGNQAYNLVMTMFGAKSNYLENLRANPRNQVLYQKEETAVPSQVNPRLNKLSGTINEETAISNTKIPQQGRGVNSSIRESGEPDTSGGIMLPTASDSDIRYSISEDFAEELEEWYYETDPRDRAISPGYFRIGTVSEPLKSIGVRDGNVYWRKSKIGTIMQDHPEIDLETAKNVPQILENPVVILKSRTQDNSITLFGDVTAANGERVMAALHLTPRAGGDMETEFTLLSSAYGRSERNVRNLLKNSEVLYLDPNKNRTNTWLMQLRVQFPSRQPAYGPIGTITYHDGEVKINGVPYDQYMQKETIEYKPENLPTVNDDDIRYSISEDFAEEIDAWDGEQGRTFVIGTTSDALQSIGVEPRKIIWRGDKILRILNKHKEMTKETIKQVPQILEYPIVILKSKNMGSRIVVFGEIEDTKGNPVTAILEINPTSRGGELLQLNIVASAYGKNNAKSFIESSDLLYLDPNKNRTDMWLQGLGLQLPSNTTTYGSIGTITYHDGEVKISGVPYDQYMQEDGEKYTPQYSISENFADEIDAWDGRSDKTFHVGTVSEALKSIGVKDNRIIWHSGKIVKILKKHHAMDRNTIKQVPQVLEHPIVVLKSQNTDSRIVMFGEIMDNAGKPITAVLELMPTSRDGRVLDLNVIASAYGKDHIKSFIGSSDLLYLDPNKKRTDTWLQGLGLQLPSDTTTYGPIGTITYHDGEVKISGVPYDQYMQEDGEKYTPQYSVDENAENERATGYDDRGERWDGTMMEIGKDQSEREAEEARRKENAEYQNYPWLYGTGETVSEAIQGMEDRERTQTPGMLPKAEADTVENLPAKAKNYFTRAERYLNDKTASVLNVPKPAGRESFQTAVREIADEYLQNGTVSEETIARVFNQAYEDSIALNRAYYEEYRELREYLETLELTITEEQANGIANQEAFLQSNRNRIGIRIGEDGNVNEVYAELQRRWPALFQRGSALTEAGKAQKIASVAQSFEVAKRSLDGYAGENANEYRRLAKHDFEAAVQDATGEFQVVRRYMEDRNAEGHTIQIPTTQEEVAKLWVQVKDARRKYERTLARNLLTEHDEIQVGRLLRGEIEPQHLDPKRDNVRGITAVYRAKREYEDLAKVIRAWNQARKAALKQQADGYLQTANDWHDKPAGILYARETMERNIRDIVPDEDLAENLIHTYFTPVHEAAAEANRMKNRYRNRVRKLELSRKADDGNLVSEAHAVQLLGEAEDNIRMLEKSRGLIRERDGKTLEEWRGAVKKLWEENPNLDAGKIRSAVEEFRKIYDGLFQMMNEARVRNGYEPVNYRSGYFPHFQPGNGDGILAGFGKAMGVTTEVSALPTTINGLTHTFRPGIQWFGNAQERLGFNTVYDAVEGFDKYIEGVSDVIFQTDNIQRLRALATQIRYRTGDEGVRKQIDDVLTNPNLTEEEKQERTGRIYESGRYALSNFVTELDEYTNLLANKKSRADRNMEQALGRNVYNLIKALESRIAANMVAINSASWLTNFIPLVQGNAMLDRGMLLRGMWDTLKAYRSDDGIVNQSSFLTNRRGSDPIVKTYEQGERAAGGAKKAGQTIEKTIGKSGEILASPMEFIDYFVADSLVRARYRQNLGKGMSEEAAMEEADAFAAGVMADRSKGAMPTLFYSRNPIVKLFTQFQLEVNNQISYILKDIPREKRKNAGRSITAMLLKFFIGSWLFNEIFEFTVGRRPALDPIGILNDTAGDLTGWELPNLVELGLGAASGNLPSFQAEQAGLYEAGVNLVESLAEQTPFIGGLLGGGRLPVSSAIPNVGNLWNAATNEDWSTEKRLQEVRDELIEKPVAYLALPFGGGQLKKIYEGIEGILEGGSYVVNAEGERQLQYPIYTDTTGETIGNAIRATLFGRTSLPTGREWIEGGFGMLSAKQTAVYEGMLEAGISGREAYELIESMRQAEKTDTESKADQQRRLLEESEISGEGKSIAYYGMLASDRERELMTSLDDDFTDMGEVTNVLLAIKDAGNLKGAAASNAKRDAILESGLSEGDKKEIYRYTFGERRENGTYTSSRDEDIRAFENAGLSFDEFLETQNEYSTINEQYDRAGDKALEFSRWVDGQPYTDKQKDVIKERFRFWSQVAGNAERYENFVDAGLSTDDAYALASTLAMLEPEEGKEQVSSYQRYTAILESSLGKQEKLDAIGAVMGTEMETESGNPTQYARLLTAMDAGVELQDWFDVTRYKSEAKTDYDEDGEEVKSAKEKVVEYIDSLNISEEEKDALYLYGCNYAESGLSDTPWQSGGWSMSDIDWSGIILPMA